MAAQLKHDRIAGYKAGMMKLARPPASRTAPVIGGLLASGARTAPTELRLSDFRQPILEIELGYEFSQAIQAPVVSIAELQSLVKSVRPAIEIADSAFIGSAAPDRPDLIAANVFASHFIRGAAIELRTVDINLNALKPRLYHKGQLVSEGIGTDTLGDQWTALHYVVNKVIAQNYAIQPGQIVITGALGLVYAGEVGEYRADYGILGKFTFTILP